MDINDTQKLASRIAEDCDLLRKIIRHEREDGRSMFYKDSYDSLAETMKSAGAMLGTAESDWFEIGDRIVKRKVAIK